MVFVAALHMLKLEIQLSVHIVAAMALARVFALLELRTLNLAVVAGRKLGLVLARVLGGVGVLVSEFVLLAP